MTKRKVSESEIIRYNNNSKNFRIDPNTRYTYDYHDNGNIKLAESFYGYETNSNLKVRQSYWYNGQMSTETKYTDDGLPITAKSWDANGNPDWKILYNINGDIMSEFDYYPNGVTKKLKNVSSTKVAVTEYDEQGTKTMLTVYLRKDNEVYTLFAEIIFYPNGNIQSESYYDKFNNQTLYKTYFLDGSKKIQQQYYKTGEPYKCWYYNGNLKETYLLIKKNDNTYKMYEQETYYKDGTKSSKTWHNEQEQECCNTWYITGELKSDKITDQTGSLIKHLIYFRKD